MFDLNEPPNYEETDTSVVENVSHISEHHSSFEPFIGQSFLSEEEACVFYQNYARLTGFSIRKDRTEKKDGKIVRRDYYCHRGRIQPLKEIDLTKEQRSRSSLKCNCNAHIRIKWRRCNEIFPEEWHITSFVRDHNHTLLSQEHVRFLPANRIIGPEDENRILLLKEASLTVRQIIRVLELENKVEHGELPYLEKDIRNLFTRVRKSITGDDVDNLIKYFKDCKEKNSNFQYVLKVDNEHKLEHLFWCPAPCSEWYDRFGDVVIFDTTYKVNMYNMPCAIFVGINNHGKTILFGCALLRNETVDTFKWLMKTFVAVMKKAPKTIITDQDPWMTQAITEELTCTKHAFCIWHITSKFSGWFTSILRERYQDWCKDFYKLYKLESIEDFENQWPLVVNKYKLKDNKHVNGLYQIRNFWVPAYLRDHYFGDTRTTGRSEYINGFIKKFVSSTSTLKDLAKQVILVCFKSSQYSILSVEGHEYIVRYYEGEYARSRKVYWDGAVGFCSCKQFEFSGILCRHIIRVFLQNNCHTVPAQYLPTRWHLEENSNSTQFVAEQNSQDNEEVCNDQSIQVPPLSKTKGRPKNKREKGGKETAKQVRCCSKCKKPGHYANKCDIDKGSAFVSNDPPSKKKKIDPNNENLNPVFNVKC